MPCLYYCEVAITKNEIETSIWFKEAKHQAQCLVQSWHSVIDSHYDDYNCYCCDYCHSAAVEITVALDDLSWECFTKKSCRLGTYAQNKEREREFGSQLLVQLQISPYSFRSQPLSLKFISCPVIPSVLIPKGSPGVLAAIVYHLRGLRGPEDVQKVRGKTQTVEPVVRSKIEKTGPVRI